MLICTNQFKKYKIRGDSNWDVCLRKHQMMLEDIFKLFLNSMKNIICCYSDLLDNMKLIDKFSLIGCTIIKINQLNNKNSQILKKPGIQGLHNFVN